MYDFRKTQDLSHNLALETEAKEGITDIIIVCLLWDNYSIIREMNEPGALIHNGTLVLTQEPLWLSSQIHLWWSPDISCL